jgi:hypothetical protein
VNKELFCQEMAQKWLKPPDYDPASGEAMDQLDRKIIY